MISTSRHDLHNTVFLFRFQSQNLHTLSFAVGRADRRMYFSFFIHNLQFCACQFFSSMIIFQKKPHSGCCISDLALHTHDCNLIFVFILFKIKDYFRIGKVISLRCPGFFHHIDSHRKIRCKSCPSTVIGNCLFYLCTCRYHNLSFRIRYIFFCIKGKLCPFCLILFFSVYADLIDTALPFPLRIDYFSVFRFFRILSDIRFLTFI